MNIFQKMSKKVKVAIATLALGTTAFLSAGFVESHFEISKNLDVFATLFKELNLYYVDETNPGELMKVGIDAMLESLDPYTTYIPESEIEDYKFMTTGQYGGVGSMVRKYREYVVITDPYEGYPAQNADLRAGDIILQIDGKSMKNKNTDDVSKMLKGQPNTEVRILIERPGEKRPIEKVVTRREIKINSVPYYGMLDNEIGYISLSGFTQNAAREVKDALIKLKENKNLKGVVLDLRNNPGGLLSEAVNIVNIFVEKGKEVVNTKGKIEEWKKTYRALNSPVDTDIPLAVLVNSGSASASEIVAGSLQDLDRAVVIGQRTYGKGLVQTTRALTYNSKLKVTTAKYYTPSGRCIQAIDYSQRNDDGSVGKIPDSLMTAYKTKNGRVVMDGGGILPDVITEPKTLANITGSLMSKLLIFDFATRFKQENPSIGSVKDFKVSDALYDKFVAYVSDKDYDYVTKSEKALEELKSSLKDEKYLDQATREYEQLKNKLSHNKKDDLITFKNEIKKQLHSEICSRYYFQKGRTESSLLNDEETKKAIEVLRNKGQYSGILNASAGNITKGQN